MPKGIPVTEYSSHDYSRNKLRSYPRVRRHRERKALLVEMLGGCCKRCGGTGPQEIFDFDHIDPATKTMEIGVQLAMANWDKLLAEIRLCQLLCANCHRIKTWEERQS